MMSDITELYFVSTPRGAKLNDWLYVSASKADAEKFAAAVKDAVIKTKRI